MSQSIITEIENYLFDLQVFPESLLPIIISYISFDYELKNKMRGGLYGISTFQNDKDALKHYFNSLIRQENDGGRFLFNSSLNYIVPINNNIIFKTL